MTNAVVRKLRRLAPLSVEDEKLLVQATQSSREVPGRSDLIRDGDQPGFAHFVLEGWACRYKMLASGDRQIMAFLLPGDFCDFNPNLLDRVDHSVGTIVACRVASISRGRMEALLATSPTLRQTFTRARLIEECVLRGWIVNMGQRDSLERVAHLMIELFVRMRNVGLSTDYSCKAPLTQTVLADAFGLTPVHVNRVIQTLRKRGVMHLGAGMLTITDPDELVRIAGFDCDYLHQNVKAAFDLPSMEAASPNGVERLR